MASQPPKVFISYNKADRDWAEWIAGVIKGAGYEPILDVWHFRPGENFVLRMHEAAMQANLTLAVLSEAYLQAAYTQPEWAAAFAPDPTGKDRRLIPVRVGKCALTGMLRSILYIDLIDLSEQNAEWALLNGLKPSGEPAQPPKFPANRAAMGVSVAPFPLNIVRRHGVPDPGVFLPDPPHDFVGRAEALKMLYAALVEKQDKALLHGEPGCGKSTLALKFAWQTQGVFDAVVFQLCGQRTLAEIAAELATKLKLGLETKRSEEQIAAAKAWLAERRALLVLDDIWENDVIALAPGPPVSLLCTSRLRSLPWISPTNSLEVKSFSRGEAESIFRIYLGGETLGKHRDALLEFAERVECLPIAIVVGADMLRRELDPVPEAARGLRLERLRNEVNDVAALLRRAIAARPEQQRRLLNAMAVCALNGFWLPLTMEIAGLTEAEGRDVRNKLVDASLLRMLDRDRQRFQLHALVREELRNLAPLEELQTAHAAALERLFADWERRVHDADWKQRCSRECRECLPEVIPAVQHLWEKSESSRAAWLTYRGFATGRRIGDFGTALRIVQQEEALCLEVGNKDTLQASYGNQTLILQGWGRLEEPMELLKKVEALCLELPNKDVLQAIYGNQALILQAWGRLEEAFELLKKKETLCLELGNKNGLQTSYGHQAVILQARGRLKKAMALLKKQEALCLELGNKDGLQRSYGNQASILKTWDRPEEAMALLKKQETLCLELGSRSGLAFCYRFWGLLARAQRDRKTEREKLTTALDIFTELNMARERDAARVELEKTTAADRAT